jgi:hypothetical protein
MWVELKLRAAHNPDQPPLDFSDAALAFPEFWLCTYSSGLHPARNYPHHHPNPNPGAFGAMCPPDITVVCEVCTEEKIHEVRDFYTGQ